MKKDIKKIMKSCEKIVAKHAKPEVLSPAQVLKMVSASVVEVRVPEWGACVRCRVPDHKTVFQLRTASANNEEFQAALFKACLVDFTAEQIEELEAGHGIKYFQLFNAVMQSADLFGVALSAEKIKN